MSEPRSALKDAAPPKSCWPTSESQAGEDGRACARSLRRVPKSAIRPSAPRRVSGTLAKREDERGPLRTPGGASRVRKPRRGTGFLVRRSVCSDRTRLESISGERDWNAQTLARSRRRLSGDEARQSVWGELRGFGAVVVERSIAIVAAILLLCADHVRRPLRAPGILGPLTGTDRRRHRVIG